MSYASWRTAQAFGRDEQGSASILVAPMMLMLLGMAALSVDMMNAYTTQERLRTAAEAAATAGVSALPDEEEALSAALLFGEKNLPENATDAISEDEVELGYWDEDSGSFEPDPAVDPVNAIRVTARLTGARGNALATFFGSVLGVANIDVISSAIALGDASAVPCVLALDPNASKAISVKSNAQLNLEGCEVHSRSTASDALFTDSNATVESDRNCVEGGAVENSNSEVEPDPEEGCEAAEDPFADLAAPAVGGCNHNNKTVDNQTVTLSPGVYCGGLTVKNNANVTFNPGVYIIKDGKFLVDSNSRIAGSGVGFYLTGSSTVLEFTSNTQVSLTAPQSGALAGMLFFQDRTTNPVNTHKFDSNTAATLDGAMYFPKGIFESNSNAVMGAASSCMMLVAMRISFDSNSRIDMNADFSQCPWIPGFGGPSHSKIVG